MQKKFKVNEERLANLFGQDAFVAAILEGDKEVFRVPFDEYQVIRTISLSELGGRITQFVPIKWEDGIIRTQRQTKLAEDNKYTALIGAPLSQAA